MTGWSARLRGVMVAVVCLDVMLASAPALTRLWEIPADGSREYISSSATERGLAYNRGTQRVYVSSRASGTQVAVLNATTGAELGFLDLTGVEGGTTQLGQLAVGEDGRLYGVNISGSDLIAPVLRVYRWDADASPPVLLYSANPNPALSTRWGDTLTVRGAGTNTQILVGGTSTSVVVLRYPGGGLTDLTAIRIEVPEANRGDFSRSLAFGSGNTFLALSAGVSGITIYSFPSPAGTLIHGVVGGRIPVPGTIGAIAIQPLTSRLVALDTATHFLQLLDVSAPTQPLLLGQISMPEPSSPNAAGMGQVAMGPGVAFSLESRNGLLAVDTSNEAGPPEILQSPVDVDGLEGGPATFTVSAAGRPPLRYQWEFNRTLVTGATNRVLTLDSATAENAGLYRVAVFNALGTNLSLEASLSLRDSVRSDLVSRVWSHRPGARQFLGPGTTHPRLGIVPSSGNLLLLHAGGTNGVYVLSGDSGELLRVLGMAGELIGPTRIVLESIAVAEDGMVYASNLTPDGTTAPLRVYQWSGDGAGVPPRLVFSGDPGQGVPNRWGDALIARGTGQGTQLLLTSRAGTNFSLLTPAAGIFSARQYSVAVSPGGLAGGLSFGSGNSFWIKPGNVSLRLIAFDAPTGTAVVARTVDGESYPAGVFSIGRVMDRNWILGVSAGMPGHLLVHDLTGESAPVWVDTEFFPTDGLNHSNTGAVVVSGNRAAAVLPDGGLIGLLLGVPPQRPTLRVTRVGVSVELIWQGSFILQRAADPGGPWTDVPGAVAGHQVPTNLNSHQFFRLRSN